MKISFGDVSELKGIFDVLSQMNEEMDMEIGPEGITVRGIDSAKVCAFRYNINPGACIEYDVAEEEAFRFNGGLFHKILKAGLNSIMHMGVSGGKLSVMLMSGDNQNKYNLAMADPEPDTHKIAHHESITKFETAEFKSIIEQIVILDSEGIGVKMFPDKVMFYATDKTNDAQIQSKKEVQNCKKPQSSKYSAEYLKKILKLSNCYDTMQVSMKTDSPLVAQYRILDKSELWVYLAPRIEED